MNGFREAYFRELNYLEKNEKKGGVLILERAAGRPITFLYASRNRAAQNNAMVLEGVVWSINGRGNRFIPELGISVI